MNLTSRSLKSMETAYMTTLLMLCSGIVAFSRGEGNDRRERYEAFCDGKNLTEANSACRVLGFTTLAKISNGNELRLARNIPSVSSGMKYLTALIYTKEKSWKWTDNGDLREDAGFLGIVDSDRVDIVSNDLQVTYCFLLANNTKLEITNCTERHGYICEGFEGAPTTATEQVRRTASATPIPSGTISLQRTPKPSGTITRQATSMPSDTIILHGIITSTTVTAKASIAATKSLSTATHVSRTSPTDGLTPEKQIQLYVSRIRNLKVDYEESLQIAVYETSALLTRFHDAPYPKTQENLLSVAQQLETFAAKHAMNHLNTTEKSATTIMKKSFVIMVQEVTAGRSNDVIFPPDDNARIAPFDLKAKIYLPAKLFKSGDAVIVGIVYKFMHKLLPDESHAFLDKKRLKNTALRSQIISCSVFPSPPDELQENVTISFKLEKRAKSEDKPHCVFWDFEEQTRFNGSWSRKGCSLVNKTKTQVTCTCNHLTNFAVLMQIGETKAPVEHQVALEIITYIGCSLSLFGEVLTVIAYLVLMNLWQEQCQIRLNLVVSIAFAQIIFLAGIDATTRHTACIFVAVAIHYFYLVGFAWMLVEGIYLYLMVVKVFNTLVKMKLFYAFSWGFPCVIVVISLVFASTTDAGVMSYIHSDFCWVSFSNNLVWTFAAPVLFVCLANSLILCRVVCEITSMQAAKNNSNFRQGLKACIVLFPLLGMTWVFGVLSVTDAGLAFQYIFTVFNSLQGFFIFVIHVLRNSDVKAAYLRKKQKLEASKDSNFQNSRFVADVSADQSKRYGMSAIRESKASPDPHLRRHQVSPINSDTRASCLTPVDS